MDKKQVIVIDDSMLIRAYVSVNLSKFGYEVIPFADATEALVTIRKSKKPPDIMFVDINMPKLNGYAFCKIMKEDKKFANIPIVFITSYNTDWDREHAKQCGANGFIAKPFPIEKLLDSIKQFS
ncbi:MAG: response regulator [Endomicrobiales bacterium]|nr:response regulator [Endomicrobiales bacterium]